MADVFSLFEEWLASTGANVEEFLARAGAEADDLRLLIELHLARAEPPPATEEAVVAVTALATGEPPLLELRRRRGLTRDALVDALIRAFAVDPAKRAKVERYYHEVETGQRRPADPRLVRWLGGELRARLEDLLAWRPAPSHPEPVYFRAAEAFAPAPASTPEVEWDEIDELFRER
jgi:hypothetical protein